MVTSETHLKERHKYSRESWKQGKGGPAEGLHASSSSSTTEAGVDEGDTVDRHSEVSSGSPEPTPLRGGVTRLQPPCGK